MGQGYLIRPGQTFEVFRSEEYAGKVHSPCVQVDQVMPRDDDDNIIDARALKLKATLGLVNLINDRGSEVLKAREKLAKFQHEADELALKLPRKCQVH